MISLQPSQSIVEVVAMPNQDAGYKLIFSNPTLVREILRSGLCDPWLGSETGPGVEKISGSLVDERLLIRRENDLVWVCQRGQATQTLPAPINDSMVDPLLFTDQNDRVGFSGMQNIEPNSHDNRNQLPPVVCPYSGGRN